DGIGDFHVTGVQTCALPISGGQRVEIGRGVGDEGNRGQDGQGQSGQARTSHDESSLGGGWMLRYRFRIARRFCGRRRDLSAVMSADVDSARRVVRPVRAPPYSK